MAPRPARLGPTVALPSGAQDLQARTLRIGTRGSPLALAQAHEVRGRLMAENNYAVEGMNFSIPLKDSRIISEHAASLGVPIPLYHTALQFYHAAVAQGMAHLDAAAVCRVMEKLANCERPT